MMVAHLLFRNKQKVKGKIKSLLSPIMKEKYLFETLPLLNTYNLSHFKGIYRFYMLYKNLVNENHNVYKNYLLTFYQSCLLYFSFRLITLMEMINLSLSKLKI